MRLKRMRTYLELDLEAARDAVAIQQVLQSPSVVDAVRRALRHFRLDVETVKAGGVLIRRDVDGCETVTSSLV